MDRSKHIQVWFEGDSIYIYITMSINDAIMKDVNADMVMIREHVYVV